MKIELVRYNDNWKKDFIEEMKHLMTLMSVEIKAIEHVGSTAIPIQLSKPVIDIFVGVDPFRAKKYYSDILDSNLYKYTITGMKDRHLFQKYTAGTWTHNIHLIKYSNEFQQRNEILFRDFIKDKADLLQEYAFLKKKLNEETADLELYTKGKTAFIQKVVDRARIEKGLPLVSVWE